METWYKVTLSQEDIATGKHMVLQNAFQTMFMLNQAPKDAAMFTHKETRAPYHYFFSPGAVRISSSLMDRYSGKECAAPQASELSLVVGDLRLAKIPFASPNLSSFSTLSGS